MFWALGTFKVKKENKQNITIIWLTVKVETVIHGLKGPFQSSACHWLFVPHNIVWGNKAEVEGELLHPDILS